MGRDDGILYLAGDDVRRAIQEIDPVAVVAAALQRHGAGQTTVPDEGYLPWSPAPGEAARSLAMPGLVGDPTGPAGSAAAGVKIINGNPANVSPGWPRASGVPLLSDIATARIPSIMEGARISALRTASVTAVAAGALSGPPVRTLAVIGAGALARAHLDLLPGRLPHLANVRLYDLDPAR